MQNGEYTFFIIEYRRTHQTDWLKPEGKLKRIKKDEEWSICGEYWSRSLNPTIGSGNRWRAKHQSAAIEWQHLRNATGRHGWTSLSNATRAIAQVRIDDETGMYDTLDTYKKLCQRNRHEFRISTVKMVYNVSIEPTTIEDAINVRRKKKVA